MNTPDAKRVLETALICASQPMPLRDMRTLFADALSTDDLQALLGEIARDCEGRGIELVALASGWRLQSRPEMREYLARLNPERPPRYSRALMETLAIIAYRQPVTRGDIEDIRGVAVASHIVKQLEDRGWVESIGFREAPGRPALLATTRQFLDDLGLASLDQLPLLEGVGTGPAAPADQVSLLDLDAQSVGVERLPAAGENPLAANAIESAQPPDTQETAEARQPAADAATADAASQGREGEEPTARDVPPHSSTSATADATAEASDARAAGDPLDPSTHAAPLEPHA
jgi:segregation and condensation protein B